jgi:diguanylate cyclase (GGDEF)-like protein/PAS domain S-box-containing protein
MNAVLPEFDTMRRRELDLYEPIFQAQEDSGQALLMTEDGRPVHWNKAFEDMSGYSTEDLDRSLSTSQIITMDVTDTGSGDRPRRGVVHNHDGSSLQVEVSRPGVSAADEGRSVWILRDISERTHAEHELRERALHDALTGLPNRALLGDRMTAAIAAAHRQHAQLSVLLIDLNGFKQVNDVHGHAAGDQILVETAKRLAASLRESDTAARLGGDEFVVLLPATALAGAIETAWTLNEVIAKPIAIGESSPAVSASIGIAMFPEHAGDATALLAAADAAMYEAKRTSAAWRSYDQLPAVGA